ncbi:MAG: hypothetical protein ACJAS1_006904, partial [Oleiphilaceae bacterium]
MLDIRLKINDLEEIILSLFSFRLCESATDYRSKDPEPKLLMINFSETATKLSLLLKLKAIKIMEKLHHIIEKFQGKASQVFSQSETYMQIAIILGIYLVAYSVANRIRKYASFLDAKSENEHHPIYV